MHLIFRGFDKTLKMRRLMENSGNFEQEITKKLKNSELKFMLSKDIRNNQISSIVIDLGYVFNPVFYPQDVYV